MAREPSPKQKKAADLKKTGKSNRQIAKELKNSKRQAERLRESYRKNGGT